VRDDRPLIRTRDDLLELIAHTLRLQLTYLSKDQAVDFGNGEGFQLPTRRVIAKGRHEDQGHRLEEEGAPMKKMLLSVLALGSLTSAALAEPVTLPNAQLEQITAGGYVVAEYYRGALYALHTDVPFATRAEARDYAGTLTPACSGCVIRVIKCATCNP
jgi:hypothetical protein